MRTLFTLLCACALTFGPSKSYASSDSGLLTAVSQSSGISQEEARKQVDTVIAAIKAELLAGRPITIRNFGRFHISELGPREVRNPRTGQKMQIEARKYPKFTSSDSFKEAFREPGAAASAAVSAEQPAMIQ